MHTIRFSLSISPEEYLRYYAGTGKTVIATSTDARQIEFPANRLVPFVTHNGIHGEFEITFDESNRFVSLKRRQQ